MPIQPFKSNAIGRIEVFRKYQQGLKDIGGFSHIILIYNFHRSRGYKLLVTPFLDSELRGLFATRYPGRPNQIGITVVRSLSRKNNILTVKGIDILDKTPLLDIKPYVPEFAAKTDYGKNCNCFGRNGLGKNRIKLDSLFVLSIYSYLA